MRWSAAATWGLILGVFGGLEAHAVAAPTVFVAPVLEPTREARWFELRAAQRITEHFETFGVVPSAQPGAGVPELRLTSTPAEVKRSADEVILSVEVRAEGGSKTHRAKGRAAELDALTAQLALAAARQLKVTLPEGVDGLVPAWSYPFAVHRYLARASVRMWRGEHRLAALMFGRAQELADRVWVPEAFEGRRWAEAHMVTLAGGDLNAKRDLASSAAERALIAFRNKQRDEARKALESFLRYVPKRALQWQVRLPFERGVVLSRRSPWAVQPEPGTLWTVDPRTGVIASRGRGLEGLVALAQDDPVALVGRNLERHEPGGRARWKLRLPAPAGPAGVVTTSGLMGVLSEDTVAWADLSIGELGQVARRVKPLASGVGGVVVLTEAKKGEPPVVGLLRPGKKTPAWTAALKDPRATALTRDRVLVVAEPGLVLLRSHDGKPVRDPLPVRAGARILGARGRYAALEEDEGQVAIVDILAAERTATVRGPGAPVGAQTTQSGIAVLFARGDLIFFDRDGKRLDRAWAPGEPKALLAGSPAIPGPVVQSTRGLYSFAEVEPKDPLDRDVDGILAAAEALLTDGNADGALRLATEVAMKSAGRVADAESLRCRILEARADAASKAAALRAKARADRARVGEQSLGAFGL